MQTDREAESLKTFDKLVLNGIRFALIKVIATQVLVDGASTDNVISNDQDRMGNSNRSALFTTASGQAMELCGQVRIVHMTNGLSSLDESGFEIAIGFVDFGGTIASGTLVFARD